MVPFFPWPFGLYDKMAVIFTESYKAPFFLKNKHLQSIYPAFFRKIDEPFYRRQRITTQDDDFLDLDWSCIGSRKLAILSHGLEGNSHRPYIVGMVNALNTNGWDALAWNFRSCSGEINRQLRLYHNGATDDLQCVIDHAIRTGRYKMMALIGFSMGGNLNLLYLGQKGSAVHPLIQKAVAVSVPCDLKAGAIALAKPVNKIYMTYFLHQLHNKIRAKMKVMPGQIDDAYFYQIKNFKNFDDRYTAPLHGFKNAEDYWTRCSSKSLIPEIDIQTLIMNAKDDPFLTASCYPIMEASMNDNILLEITKHGGHVGFIEFNDENLYWSEKRVIRFLNE